MKYTKIENGKRVWDTSKTHGLFEKQTKFYASGISEPRVTKAHRKNLESLAGVLKFILTDELGFKLLVADSDHHKYQLYDSQGGGVDIYIWFALAEITCVGRCVGHKNFYNKINHFDEFFDRIRWAWKWAQDPLESEIERLTGN